MSVVKFNKVSAHKLFVGIITAAYTIKILRLAGISAVPIFPIDFT